MTPEFVGLSIFLTFVMVIGFIWLGHRQTQYAPQLSYVDQQQQFEEQEPVSAPRPQRITLPKYPEDLDDMMEQIWSAMAKKQFHTEDRELARTWYNLAAGRFGEDRIDAYVKKRGPYQNVYYLSVISEAPTQKGGPF